MLAAWLLLQDLSEGVLPQGTRPQDMLPFAGDEPERARDLVSAAIEVGILAWLFYAFLRFLHGKAGLSIFKGVLLTLFSIVAGLMAISLLMGVSFPRLQYAAMQMLPVLAVVLVVLFQPELRRGFLALSEPLNFGDPGLPGHVADLSNSFRALARRRHGALVVFEGRTGIKGLQDTGVPLDAGLSGALLESIFYPKSPMHDGAVIVRNGRIVAASCMLPLSESTTLSRELGTRHRAALGVTEESDAVAVVVSEETGRISLVHKGRLTPVEDSTQLEERLSDYLHGTGAENGR
jgi:diadenylate cyclase